MRYLSPPFETISGCKYPLILSLIILFHTVNNAIWLRIDTLPPLWDEAYYMFFSLLHYNALMAEGIPELLKSFIHADPTHAPLPTILPLPVYLTLGISEDKTLIVNMIAFAILLVSTYKIGQRLISAAVGALAAFLVSMYPIIFGLSRIFLVECALIAVVTLSLYLLLLTEGFAKRCESIWFGVALGLGMLTKVFFPVFMFGSILVVLYYMVQNRLQSRQLSEEVVKSVRWSKWVNLSVCATIAVAIASVWYVPNMASVISRSLSVSYGEVAKLYGPANPLTPTALASYFILFSSYDISFLGLVTFVISLVMLISGRFSRSVLQQVNRTMPTTFAFWLLLSWIIVPYAIFSTAPNQDLKHISPIVPAIALLSAWGVLAIKQRAVKLALLIGLTLWALIQFFGISYGISGFPKTMAWKLPLPQTPPLVLFWQNRSYTENGHSYIPFQENWKIPAILAYIDRINQRERAGRAAVVGMVPSYPTFEINAFKYYALRQKMPFSCIWVAPSEEPREIDYRSNLLACDFVVVKNGFQGPAFVNRYNDGILALLKDPAFGFLEAPQKFDLPDGSQAAVFFQVGQPEIN
jgi:4-amino-4-deoxy-L-arabinose transferase-like glycosyltransferase